MSDPTPLRPSDLRIEHRIDALGVGERTPRISWREPDDQAAHSQYEIEVRASATERWTATTAQTVLADWPAPPLSSRDRREVRVRSIGTAGTSAWSEPVAVEAGLLEASDWVGSLIEAPSTISDAPVIRQQFHLDGDVESARLYVVWRGVGEARINGVLVSEDVLAPGWYSYPNRDLSWTYDVTELLVPGRNVIELRLGNGWYAGRVGFFNQTAVYGERPAVLAQLESRASGGEVFTIATDTTWLAATGPILRSDIYNGEAHDARAEVDEWSGFDPDHAGDRWVPTRALKTDLARIEPALLPPSRRHETRLPQEISTAPSGEILVDFGQNLVGRVQLDIDLPAGATVTLRHAEVLENGELAVAELRSAASVDAYTSDGTPTTWEPSFTFHGFRYLGITGWSGPLDAASVRAVVIHTQMRRVGEFTTSHPSLQQLHDNVVWSTRGNFLSLPTDCPQRDERLGWTGDIAVFAPTASYLFDATAMLQSWLRDVALEQSTEGSIPHFVPMVPYPENVPDRALFKNLPTAVWGDAAVLVPWALYEATGDAAILDAQYESMRRWVDFIEDRVGPSRIWDGDFQYGDWLDPTAPAEDAANGATDPVLVATAYFAHSAALLSASAAVLDKPADAERYRALAADVRAVFRGRFVGADGTLSSDSQTAYAIVLRLGLLENRELERVAGERLVALVRESGHRIGTGFVGTPLILDALTQVGAVDDAYRLVLQTELPSWMYAVERGATTMWERWDSLLPDGSVNPSGMTSFNHYAFGVVASWLHSTVGGLSLLEPGYRRFRIAPKPYRDVQSAATSHDTPYGRAAVSWRVENAELHVEVVVPPFTTAEVDIEGLAVHEVGPGEHAWIVRWLG